MFAVCCLSPYLPPLMTPTLGDYKVFEVGDLCVDLLKDCEKRDDLFIYLSAHSSMMLTTCRT